MMLKPYMCDLLKKVNNRYLLVNVTAKRARDIADESEQSGIDLEQKPVTTALEEIYDGTVTPVIRQEGIVEGTDSDNGEDLISEQEQTSAENMD